MPIEGVGKKRIGTSIHDIRPGSPVIDFVGEIFCQKHGRLEMRVVGFWNPEEKIYHWYTTNLKATATLIYPIYRLRWQIELIFKSCKTSLNLNEIPTGNKNIVLNLLLSSILAYLVSLATLSVAKEKLNKKQQEAITAQRIGRVMVHLSADFARYILERSRKAYSNLKEKIYLFAKELFDPNFHKRKTSIQMAISLC